MTHRPQTESFDRAKFELRSFSETSEGNNALRQGIHRRGYLPHVKNTGAWYFVTSRLADSLPAHVLDQMRQEWRSKRDAIPEDRKAERREVDLELQRQIERYLDRGIGECHLGRPEVAQLVEDSLYYYRDVRYRLDEWVIMPNHMHVILWPIPNHTLSGIMKSFKGWTGRQANRILNRSGQRFWQRESYDHWIRDTDELNRIRRYIRYNPVSAGLCREPEDWRWSSAWKGRTDEKGR